MAHLSVIREADDARGKEVNVEQINGGDVHPHARLGRIDDGLY